MPERRIRITAQHRDPIITTRLLRLLIAQAEVELKRQRATAAVEQVKDGGAKEAGHD